MRVMGLLDKNEEGEEWRGWWDYSIRKKRVMGLLDKTEEGDGIISIRKKRVMGLR